MRAAEELRHHLKDESPIELLAIEPEVSLHAYHLLVGRYHAERCRGLSQRRFILALCAEGIPCNAGWPSTLSGLSFLASICEAHPTPVADRAVKETVWINRSLLLQDSGVEQIVEAIEKIQSQADALGAGR